MEFSEAFRAEDIAKTDFFDFVVTPEDMGNDMVLHNNFPPWSRKGLFSNNNNNSSTEDLHANSGDGPAKHEANNNVLPNFADDSFWDTGGAKAFAAAAAAVNIKMESPTLDDINDICWSSNVGVANPEASSATDQPPGEEKQDGDGNTDGSIYTLTVVNGQDGPRPPANPQGGPPNPEAAPLWYRPPDLIQGDEQLRMSAMDPDQTSLDIDSIISILPSLPSMAESLQGHSLFTGPDEHHPDDLMTAACDDSGFVESKDDAKQPQGAQGQPRAVAPVAAVAATEQYSENNNDWAYSNHNEGHEGGHSTAESLLRSALQGGKSYLNQYNGIQHLQDNKTLTELGPPTGQTDLPSLGLYMSGDGMLPLDGGMPMYDDGSANLYGNGPASCTSACTSTTCMDDILLSPLDDYEKLKMIENEVAESAKRYGVPGVPGVPHHHQGAQGNHNGMGHYAAVPAPTPTPHSSTPTTPRPKKKSNKRSGDRPSSKTKSSSGSSSVSSSGGLGSATPSSNGGSSGGGSGGARRERSLHHCTICSKAFKDKYSVNVHIRTHTGEKPFACSVCGKSFRQKAHLAKHYHTHIVQKSEHLGPAKVSTKAR